jgi:hypothetical protein
MPCTASFDLPAYDENGKWCSSIARVMEKDLDVLVDKITNAVDKREWHGVHRWGRALGKYAVSRYELKAALRRPVE